MSISRRNFLASLMLGSTLSLLSTPSRASATAMKVVVIGGGSGGATAARYLHRLNPSLQITLIEANQQHQSLLMSGEVLAGMRSASSLIFDHLKLTQLGINVINERVIAIDAAKRQIKTESGGLFPYERCIVSPGISFRWDEIEGYDAQIAEQFPHAWRGSDQLATLQKQLHAMRDGGTAVIAIPKPPYRAPAAPYERASLMAHYLQQQKPKSKIIIVDANPTFVEQKGFTQAWRKRYHFTKANALIERQTGVAVALDAANQTLITDTGERIKADLINLIPPQQAGKIAITADLVDENGWCPVNLLTFESLRQSNIHVIGDAAIAGEMSKLASSANAQGKACAAAVVALLAGRAPMAAPLSESSYAIIGPEFALPRSAMFKPTESGDQLQQILAKRRGKKVRPRPLREFYNAQSWYNNITRDIFG